MTHARYLIGIDLGTTNTAVAFVDTQSADQRVQMFAVPQLVAAGEIAPRLQLPSFVYLAGDHDLGAAGTALPWDPDRRQVVGTLARAEGARTPQRVVASSKSWLCHAGVDRHAAILPWAIKDGPRLSPVDASAAVVRQVVEGWNHAHRDDSSAAIAEQEVVITVPASFDEAARELTLEAAHAAGLPKPVLLEEPQAAFYAWMNCGATGSTLRPGDTVLVFDVGGGTTDFTIISVSESGDGFERVAVGDHVLLGGDNIDLTLARHIEARLTGGTNTLDPLRWHALVHACRMAKEDLLSDGASDVVPIAVAGQGARLIGNVIKTELTRSELDALLLDGFFPMVARNEPRRRARSGLQEFGLPYAADPAITRHLATFLARHDVTRIDAVLFNGGTMAPPALRERILEQISRWQPEGDRPRALTGHDLALAVAMGAAHYGLARHGLGTRITGGTARSFYVGVGRNDGQEQAVCLAPRGLSEGSRIELQRDFQLLTNRPVSFKLFSSTTRDDEPGAVVPIGDGRPETLDDGSDLLELPPIVTVLRAPGRGEVTVHLDATVTEVGTLEIACHETTPAVTPNRDGQTDSAPMQWKLSFDMRAGGARTLDASGTDAPADQPSERVVQAQDLIRDTFQNRPDALSGLIKQLEQVLQSPRDQWSISVTRALFDAAFQVVEARGTSAQHEARWLNLVGFCLRPGCGAPADDWRGKQMWGVVFHQELQHPKDEQCRLAWWIAWRRIAGGLNAGQQHQLYLRLAQLFLPSRQGKKRWHEIKPSPQEAAEMLRCLGNLERCTPEQKTALGDEVIKRMVDSKRVRGEPVYFWVIGRLGARMPFYGPLNALVPVAVVERWIETLLALDWPDAAKSAFSMAQLGRRTGDRSRDIDVTLRDRLAARLEEIPSAERSALLIREVVDLQAREEFIALGDSLPTGLRLLGQSQTDG